MMIPFLHFLQFHSLLLLSSHFFTPFSRLTSTSSLSTFLLSSPYFLSTFSLLSTSIFSSYYLSRLQFLALAFLFTFSLYFLSISLSFYSLSISFSTFSLFFSLHFFKSPPCHSLFFLNFFICFLSKFHFLILSLLLILTLLLH